MSFTHLNIRTVYSFFNSTIKIDQLVNRASESNFSALALTDENVLYGVIPFYKACINNGIKPIIGMIVQVQINDQRSEEHTSELQSRGHLVCRLLLEKKKLMI